uniref:Zinc finger C2HC-type containing 1C n=1 Tax=Pelodiscus sinensis TaxID=13735 RepID=K7GHG3_PELSI|nr:zinc finger C2HC domain-containing protein 1C [Pelodiscus sinensis]XP_025037758.1 zinc finger C2HC domain-containing protein 1C [Pelodiscus sinensis]XP_025037759.1 zinc finger C2HC domain-containing protein 1C [Pelodiscus sinensis]|eukprot:XP_006117825.1 zinc finger C2HC domain-containing protein 1C [Pelodiscus sinensis]
MAQLQLAVYPPVDSMVTAPSLPLKGPERYHLKALGYQSRLEHLKNNFQQQLLREKEEKLKGLYICKSWNGSSQQDFWEQGVFYSAGLHSRCLPSQTSTLPSKWAARRREGVDRSYPLKPVFHHKAGSVPEVSIGHLRSLPPMAESPSSRFSSKKRGRLPAARTQTDILPSLLAAEQPKLTATHPGRAELGYIQRLEAAGKSLEEEIRKKEAFLREKLRRTEEELRRIQREKEQVEMEERNERKTAGLSGGNIFRATAKLSEGDFDWEQSSEGAMSMPSNTHLPYVLGIEGLKKGRLVASNSKIQEHMSLDSMASCAKVVMMKHSHRSPAAAPLKQDPGAELLHLQAPTGGEQGELAQCGFCGRKFLHLRLEKHMNICSKSQGSKRKVFDSSMARARGTELEQYQHWKGKTTTQNEPPKNNNWRQKHESFIQTLRQAREMQHVISKGGKLSDLPPLPPVENPDYVSCPHCSRRFAPKVAERHIPKCKTIKNRPPPPPQRRR